MPVAQSGCIEVPVSVVPEITSKKAFNPRRETSSEAKRAARRMGRGRERTPADKLLFSHKLSAVVLFAKSYFM